MKAQILVVDDEKQIRDMLSRHFRYLGYAVSTAEDGCAALKHLESNKVDILITDIMMPNMDGIELTTRVRAEYPLVRMIVVTGYVTLTNALATMQNGADALIPKPLEDMAPLEHAVARSAEILQGWVDQLAILTRGKPGSEGKAHG